MNVDSETSVIIAGAGPVGLGLACELELRGIDCLLVEKRDGTVTVPKQSTRPQHGILPPLGVAAAVRNAVWPESHPRDFVYLDSLRGRELMRVKVPSYGQRDRAISRRKPPALARKFISIPSCWRACGHVPM
jgi:FAD binding domain-containing protein